MISPEKEKYGVFTAELGRDALLRASAQRDPVTAMRELRESLVEKLEHDRNVERAYEMSRAKEIGGGKTSTEDDVKDITIIDQNERVDNTASHRTVEKTKKLMQKRDEADLALTGDPTKDSSCEQRNFEKRLSSRKHICKSKYLMSNTISLKGVKDMKIWLVEKLPQGNHSVAENHSVALALAAATEVQVSEDKVEENKNYQVYEKKNNSKQRN